MPTLFETFSNQVIEEMEEQLYSMVEELHAPKNLKDAMLYSLKAGGKRIRPILVFATLDAYGQDFRKGIPVACALEMIHTYSLIHDDLPSMDDDDLRRGMPTNHIKFGEAHAILAGDSLLTFAFEVMTKLDVASDVQIRLIKELAIAAGPEGMVGGQVADMEGESRKLSLEELEYIHRNKTGKLLAYGPVAGAILAGASDEEVEKIREFAQYTGLAFQIQDDILDIEGSESLIGKPVGSDIHNDKTTYVSLYSLEEAKNILEDTNITAKTILNSLTIKQELLLEICDIIVNRKK